MRKSSKVCATSHFRVIPPGTDTEHPEGGFYFYPDKIKTTGCLEGQAVAVGRILADLMNHDWMEFEDRMEYANMINEVMDSLDDSGEARRVLHLATRERTAS